MGTRLGTDRRLFSELSLAKSRPRRSYRKAPRFGFYNSDLLRKSKGHPHLSFFAKNRKTRFTCGMDFVERPFLKLMRASDKQATIRLLVGKGVEEDTDSVRFTFRDKAGKVRYILGLSKNHDSETRVDIVITDGKGNIIWTVPE